MNLKSIIAAVLVILSFNSSAQNWAPKFGDSAVNAREVYQNFMTAWEGKEPGKGEGYKQFMRWWNFVEPRLDEDGYLPAAGANYQAWQDYKASHPQLGNTPEDLSSSCYWEFLGPDSINVISYAPGIGRVNIIAVDPNDSTKIYAGTPAGGFWRSTDGGKNWETTTDDQPTLGVSAIGIDPNNSNTIYIGTGDSDGGDTYGIGVLKSTDGGNTFSPTGLSWTITQYRRVNKILMHPTSSDTIYMISNVGVYRTGDAGVNWTLIRSGNTEDIEFKPGDPTTIYISDDELFISTNSGASFTPLTSGLPLGSTVNRSMVAVTPANPNYIYYLANNNDYSYQGLYLSTNGGASFTQQSSSPNIFSSSFSGTGTGGQSWYDMAIAVHPTRANEVYIGGVNIWKSTNFGASWGLNAYWVYSGNPAEYTHADIHYLGFHQSTLFCGSDGGVFYSADTGGTWNNISSGLHITQFYRLGVSQSQSGVVALGTQDNGSNIQYPGQYFHVFGGDGMEAIIDYSDSNTVYTETQYGGIRKSTNGGASFTSIKPSGAPSKGAWNTPYVIHPSNPNILFIGYDDVFKTTNGGSSWTTISTNIAGGSNLRTLVVSQSNPDYLYAGTYDSIWKTTNGGSSWVNVTSNLPTPSYSYITIHPTNPNRVWVTLSGYSGGEKIYETTNGGVSWTNISGTLPNTPANCVTFVPGYDEDLFIGTDLGIYHRDSTMTDWLIHSDSLPNVIVSEMEYHTADKILYAATYGRGLWAMDFCFIANTKPTAAFSISDTTVCLGESVMMTDMSLNGPITGYAWDVNNDGTDDYNTASIVHSYTNDGNHTIRLIVDNGVDKDTTFRTILVHPKPNVVFSNLNSTYCVDDPASNLVGTPSGGTWTGAFSGIFSPPNVGVGTYEVIYTYSDANQCSNADTQSTVVYGLPTVSIQGLATEYCESDPPITVTGTPTGGLFTGLTGSEFSPLANGPGTHTVEYTYTDGNGCSNSEQMQVEVKAAPFVNLGNDTTIANGTTINLSGPSGTVTYSWSTGDILQNVTINKPGVYWCRATSPNGCQHTDTIVVSSVSGIGLVSWENEINISPNPTRGNAIITIAEGIKGLLEVKIYDARGRVVHDGSFNANTSSTYEINMVNWAPGSYNLSISGTSGFLNQQIIKLGK